MIEPKIISSKDLIAQQNLMIQEMRGLLNFCAGVISTMKQHENKHPEDVLKWIESKGS